MIFEKINGNVKTELINCAKGKSIEGVESNIKRVKANIIFGFRKYEIELDSMIDLIEKQYFSDYDKLDNKFSLLCVKIKY